MIRSRSALLLAACALLFFPLAGARAASAVPNVVVILADDLGIGDVGIYAATHGAEVISTPNIDTLAESGVRFTQGYVSHPVCSPSRAGLLTGRYQQRHGWEFNPAGRDRTIGMSPQEATIGTAFQALGYATGLIGKWHLGNDVPFHPLNRGFDEFFGVLDGGTTFIDSRVAGVEYGSIRGEPGPTNRPNAIYRGFEPEEVTAYLTDAFTEEAVGFIRRHADEPFMLLVSHTTPHTPLQATAEYLDRYRHIEDTRTRVYAAMVASLDDSVGRIVETLCAHDIYEDTLIVFLSDNGCADYIRGACSNSIHAGFKRYHHEGGVRVPFLMSWPRQLPAGLVYRPPVISLDLLATLTAAAGAERATEDSVNLLPYLIDGRPVGPHEHLYWRSGPTVAIRDERWKLIRYNRTKLTAADLNATGRLDPPAGGWPVDSPHGQVTLLYDLLEDPAESKNLALEHPEIVGRLAVAHERWAATLVEPPLLPAIRSTLAEIDGETVQLIF